MTDHVFRELEVPFPGSGILTPEMTPTFDEALSYLKSLGASEHDWMFIDYSTWAGPVEYLLAFGVRNNEVFGPFEGEDDDGEEAYLVAMNAFGLTEKDAVPFAPFARGFWGSL